MSESKIKKVFSLIAPFFGGALFAMGLSLSGMTRPSKIIGFLDVFGDWDATLLFVMFGAVIVYAISYRLVKKRNVPFFTNKFHIPNRRDVDIRLVSGAIIFGAGWGIAGFCPGPGLTALVSGKPEVITFVLSMLAGMTIFQGFQSIRGRGQ